MRNRGPASSSLASFLMLLAAAGFLGAPARTNAAPATKADTVAKAFTDDHDLSQGPADIKGWAADTRGGQGGRILRVTTLEGSGPGSFAEAVAQDGPRIIVFEVGGVIDLKGATVRINQPFVTVAGQTAPHPGITFIRGEFSVATHEVIVQHIAVRPGANDRPKRSGGLDGMSLRAAYNVIIDHCSFSWATDENLTAGGPRFQGSTPDAWRAATSNRVTFSHNIVSEGLRDSVHEKGEHSKGSLVHDNASRILFYGNLYNSNEERSPLVKGGAHVAIVNNLIHNPGGKAIHYNLIAHEWGEHAPLTGKVTMIGNVYRAGANTRPGVPLFSLGGSGDVEVFMKDNVAQDENGNALPATGRYTASGAKIITVKTPYIPPGLTVLPSARLENAIYVSAGMRPWQRDAVDFKAISDVAEGRGLIVDSEADAFGYPKYKPSQRPFNEAEWHLDDMRPKAGWAALATPVKK